MEFELSGIIMEINDFHGFVNPARFGEGRLVAPKPSVNAGRLPTLPSLPSPYFKEHVPYYTTHL
jgi:hypothetical protein